MKILCIIVCLVGSVLAAGLVVLDIGQRAVTQQRFDRAARQCESTGGDYRPVRYLGGGKSQTIPVYDCVR